jgi:hypothetical protein
MQSTAELCSGRQLQLSERSTDIHISKYEFLQFKKLRRGRSRNPDNIVYFQFSPNINIPQDTWTTKLTNGNKIYA